MNTEFFIYILRCEDNTLYTGIATDVKRRFEEHLSNGKGAKYTKSHKPIKVEAIWSCKSKSSALRLEYRIKQLTKAKKEELIANNNLDLLSAKLEISDYSRVNLSLPEIQNNPVE